MERAWMYPLLFYLIHSFLRISPISAAPIKGQDSNWYPRSVHFEYIPVHPVDDLLLTRYLDSQGVFIVVIIGGILGGLALGITVTYIILRTKNGRTHSGIEVFMDHSDVRHDNTSSQAPHVALEPYILPGTTRHAPSPHLTDSGPNNRVSWRALFGASSMSPHVTN